MQKSNGPVSSWGNIQNSINTQIPFDERHTAEMPLSDATASVSATLDVASARPIASQQPTRGYPKQFTEREAQDIRQMKARCKQLGISLFFQHASSIRSLGITSAIQGEGKTFLSTIMAQALAEDSSEPITLLECNWERPQFHSNLGCQLRPGLAELIRGECSERDVRLQITPKLSIIPAGEASQDGIKLLQQIQKEGLSNIFEQQHANDLLILDLPEIVTSPYGTMAASLVDALILVVHAGVTPANEVEAAYLQLKGLPVHGIVLNEIESKIPHALRQLF